MSTKRLAYLLEIHMAGIATTSERQELMQLIRNAAYDDALKSHIKVLWDEMVQEHHLAPPRAGQLFDQIMTAADGGARGPVQQPDHNRRLTIWWSSIAASVALLVIGLWWYMQYEQDPLRQQVGRVEELAQREHRIVKLPDGSTGTLHQGSRLQYPETFDDMSFREVSLDGEAFFDVTSNDRPFVVRAAQTKTTVLGTAFSIKVLNGKSVTVTVARGKVKVEDNVQDYGVLLPEQQLVLRPSIKEEKTQVKRAMPEWMDQVVYFDDITMEDAVKELEQRFAVNITITDEAVKQCRFTAGFVKNENLEQILKVITVFNNAHYSISKNRKNVSISGEGCATGSTTKT